MLLESATRERADTSDRVSTQRALGDVGVRGCARTGTKSCAGSRAAGTAGFRELGRQGALAGVLVGSYVWGDATPESDVDLIVIAAGFYDTAVVRRSRRNRSRTMQSAASKYPPITSVAQWSPRYTSATPMSTTMTPSR